MKTIRELVVKQAKDFPKKAAIIFEDHGITFGELKDRVFRLANNLKDYGIRKGDKVALYLPNWPEYIYSYLALFSIGATVVPFDFMLKNDELEACLAHSDSVLLIARGRPDVSLESIRTHAPKLKNIMLVRERKEGCLCFEEFCDRGSSAVPSVDIKESDPSLILYTSGSTGRPKGVLLNYRHLNAAPDAMEFFVDLTPADVKLSALPLSHGGGLVYLQNCIFYGITLILMERFIPVEYLKNIEKYKVTCFHMVPSMYYALLHLKEFEKYDLSSIRWVNVFGAPNSPDAIRRFKTYCPNAKLLNGWGMTETNAPNVVTPMGSDKIESIGRPAPWIDIRLVDDDDRDVVEGEVGEIVLKSWVVMDGYYKDPALTAEVLRNGWFHTGDLGRRDTQGMYYIAGRKKDMVKVSGQIVFPAEIEEAIHKHPDIAEVGVIGVSDVLRGEVLKAFLVLKPGATLTEQEVKHFCREHLAHFKLPHSVVFVENLPKTRTGKIDKAALRRNNVNAGEKC
ncbi:MAG: class I adenylate-forming enzyme family protein [Candidatus Omnitrophica bacterium]|nr:class I adenylate-forming enzyme family protein [Candidatus Omnitrophota bacterium]MDD5574435.1 class I adenylate-forming enzyme family protein [Candidatus Omnitrophota bacterium]